jgi:hypothetical protein
MGRMARRMERERAGILPRAKVTRSFRAFSEPSYADPPTFHESPGEEDAFQVGERPHGTGKKRTTPEGPISDRPADRRRPGTSKNPAR